MPRGSREQILHWTDQPRFLAELLGLVPKAVECCVTASSHWMPMGVKHPKEARLGTFECDALPEEVRKQLTKWWLAKAKGANTPNWDIALCCNVAGKPGLILVEAKAHERELDERGKQIGEDAKGETKENQQSIADAIGEAQKDMLARNCLPGVTISHERSYQLANRIAFAWWLASKGIPTVLIYLGFIGDKEIANVGIPFSDDSHWHRHLRTHLSMAGDEEVEIECQTGAESFWLISRTRPAVASQAAHSES